MNLFGKEITIDRGLCHIRDKTCQCEVCLQELEECRLNGDEVEYMECIQFV